jgi:hypothetical protein
LEPLYINTTTAFSNNQENLFVAEAQKYGKISRNSWNTIGVLGILFGKKDGGP